MFKSRAFSLIELITVVIIIAVLSSIALPVYTKAIERSRDQEAVTNLNLIKSAELIYYAENNSYWPPIGSPSQSVDAINSALRLNLNDNNFTYVMDDSTAPDYFAATATRSVAPYQRIWRATRALDPYHYWGTFP